MILGYAVDCEAERRLLPRAFAQDALKLWLLIGMVVQGNVYSKIKFIRLETHLWS
jgi:hypothetical protein